MYVVREVAQLVAVDTIEVVKQLNHESLDGIQDWSHCWLVTEREGTYALVLCEIIEVINLRQLRLKFSEPLVPGSRIIDVKPVHPCDLGAVPDTSQLGN